MTTYGGIWKGIGGNIGTGGQAHVVKVSRISGNQDGPYAIKVLKNPKRIDRFRTEVEPAPP